MFLPEKENPKEVPKFEEPPPNNASEVSSQSDGDQGIMNHGTPGTDSDTMAVGAVSQSLESAMLVESKPLATMQVHSATFQALARKKQERLFSAMWRSPDHIHQLGALDRKTKKFRNYHVADIAAAVSRALAFSDDGVDAYFACAEFVNAFSRCAENALGAGGFWMDVDCGDKKATDGKGYAIIAVALHELEMFYKAIGLPMPTHEVDSGGGLHVYWVLDRFVDRETWQKYATMLKALTKACGFLADDSRTADIASVLRVPGTLNFKYVPPRPVVLLQASDEFIDTAIFFSAIDAAYEKFCPASATKAASSSNDQANSNSDNSERYSPDLERLESALAILDPDCSDKTWKFYRIAPMARAAYLFPDQCDALYKLAKSWSSGELCGTPSVAWTTPGESNGLNGEQVFDSVWERFHNDKDTGRRTSLGTIYHEAKEAGWAYTRSGCSNDAEDFEQCETTVIYPEQKKPAATASADKATPSVGAITNTTAIATPDINSADTVNDNVKAKAEARANFNGALAGIQQQFALINMNGTYCVFDQSRLATLTEKGKAQPLVLSKSVDADLMLERELRATYPQAKARPVIQEFWISPQTICYTGVDFDPSGTSSQYLNLWVGPTIISKAGDWVLIRAFFLEVICNGDEVCFQYFIGYIAHALQRPWEKPGVMIILIGGQGIGKGTVARILGKIWGATFLQIANVDSVTGNFNASLERAYIVFMDEALFAGDHKAANNLKSLVTEPVIHINEKYQPARQTSSYHRFFAATNADHLKNTDRDDRRDFALRVSEARKGDFKYWTALNHEIDNGGVEAMVHDLLAMNLAGFNVRAKPDTKELLAQKLQSLGPIARWWHECLTSGEMSIEGDWPDFISTDYCIKDIWEMTGGKSFKKPAAIDVVQALAKLCPSAITKQQKDNFGARKRGFALPSIDDARAEFDHYIGGAVNWPDANSGDIPEVSSGNTTEDF